MAISEGSEAVIGFGRLPPELLPLILAHLVSPSDLQAAALVSSAWTTYATEVLYAHVWVRPWQKGADRKVRSSCRETAVCLELR